MMKAETIERMKAVQRIKLTKKDLQGLLSLLEKETMDHFTAEETPFGGIWFKGSTTENELYLKSNIGDVLVISRIGFQKRRSGIGSKVLGYLTEFALEKGFHTLLVESTLTKEMNAFCKKHGFHPISHQGTILDGEFYGNFQRKVVS